MESQDDKTFRQAIEALNQLSTSSTEQEAYERLNERVKQFAPLAQQAMQDGRSIESVVNLYFSDTREAEMMMSIFRAALLRQVLDTALEERRLSQVAHHELFTFLWGLVEKAGKGSADRD